MTMSDRDAKDAVLTSTALALMLIGEEVEQPNYSGKPRMKRYIEILEELATALEKKE